MRRIIRIAIFVKEFFKKIAFALLYALTLGIIDWRKKNNSRHKNKTQKAIFATIKKDTALNSAKKKNDGANDSSHSTLILNTPQIQPIPIESNPVKNPIAQIIISTKISDSEEKSDEENNSTDPTGDISNGENDKSHEDNHESSDSSEDDDGRLYCPKKPIERIVSEKVPPLVLSLDDSAGSNSTSASDEFREIDTPVANAKTDPVSLRKIHENAKTFREEKDEKNLSEKEIEKLKKNTYQTLQYEKENIDKLKKDLETLFIEQKAIKSHLTNIDPTEQNLIFQRDKIKALKNKLQELYENNAVITTEECAGLKGEIRGIARAYDALVKNTPKAKKYSSSICEIINSNELSLDRLNFKIQELDNLFKTLNEHDIPLIQTSASELRDKIDQKNQVILEKQTDIRTRVDFAVRKINETTNTCAKLKTAIVDAISAIAELMGAIEILEKGLVKDDVEKLTQFTQVFDLLYRTYEKQNNPQEQTEIVRIANDMIFAVGTEQEKISLKNTRLAFYDMLFCYCKSLFPAENNFQRTKVDDERKKFIIDTAAYLHKSINTHIEKNDGIADGDNLRFKEYLTGLIAAAEDNLPPGSSPFHLLTPFELAIQKILLEFSERKTIRARLGATNPIAYDLLQKSPHLQSLSRSGSDPTIVSKKKSRAIIESAPNSVHFSPHVTRTKGKEKLSRNQTFMQGSSTRQHSSNPTISKLSRRLFTDLSELPEANVSPQTSSQSDESKSSIREQTQDSFAPM